MAWSTGRGGNKSIINKHTLRVFLLLALAWIVVYNFLHYDEPKTPPEGDETFGQVRIPWRRPPQQIIPDVNIAGAGPQIGRVNVDITDDKIVDTSKPPSKAPHPNHYAYSPPSSASPKTPSSKPSQSTPSKPPSPWRTHLSTDPSDPITRLTFTRPASHPNSHTEPNLLALVMTKDASSWGTNGGDTPHRTFASYLSMLSTQNSGLNLSTTSLGLLTSSQTEFDLYTQLLLSDSEGFASATVILHPGYATRPRPDANDTDSNTDWRASRHDNNIQHDRRAEMARLRNYLMFVALGAAPSAKNILWIDADVYELSPQLLPDMTAKLDDHESVGVVTVISHFGGGGDYDLNAYRGPRSKPNEEQRGKLRTEIGSWTAGMDGGRHISHVLEKIAWQREKEREKGEAAGEGEAAFDPAKAEFDEGLQGDADTAAAAAVVEKRAGGDDGSLLQRGSEVVAGGVEVVRRLVKRGLGSLPAEAEPSASLAPLTSRGALSPHNKRQTNDHAEDPWYAEPEIPEIPGLLYLDAVGATVVMMKSSLVHQGLAFSTSYLVGTDWEGEGWDAVESEGLCVTARTLGARCFALVEGFSRHCVG